MKDILVTGGTGFIGSHLVEALVARGNRVRCLVVETSNIALLKNLGVEIVYGDLLNKESLLKAVEGVEIVYHLAAKVRPYKVIERVEAFSDIYQKANITGTINLSQACLRYGIKKFVHFSSIAAAGPGMNVTESSLCRPVTDYGKSKFKAEKYLINLFASHKFPAIIIRPGLIYGPRGSSVLILSYFVGKHILPIIGNSVTSIPMCYIDDLIGATLSIADKGRAGEIYFVVEKSYSISEIGKEIARVLNKKLYRVHLSTNMLYTLALIKEMLEKILGLKFSPFNIDISKEAILSASANWTCSNNKIKNDIGFAPSVSLKSGIEQTISQHKKKDTQ